MSQLDKDIRELAQKTERTRLQFLLIELATCSTSLEMARYEMSVGNNGTAVREVFAVEKGIRIIERFLPEIRGDQRPQIEEPLADLKAALYLVRRDLESSSPSRSTHPDGGSVSDEELL